MNRKLLKLQVNKRPRWMPKYSIDLKEKGNCGVALLANLNKVPSHDLVKKSLEALENLTHRSAFCKSKEGELIGDGAGISFAIPHKFFKKQYKDLPEEGNYGVCMTFLPQNDTETYKRYIEKITKESGLQVLWWREVPKNNKVLPKASKLLEPSIQQLFVKPIKEHESQMDFERTLFVVRNLIENHFHDKYEEFYICSFSSRTCVYKGLLTPAQFSVYFEDLLDEDFQSYNGMVHSRFSTNTHPSWSRAQPLRAICHNGEINTLRGNINQLKSREGLMKSTVLQDLKKILPIVKEGGSDSAAFDNVAELLMMSGRSLMESLLMMVPEAWQNDKLMSDEKKSFYEYNAMMMEPWDGPGLFCFSDGEYLGAILDRNGLRPARYYLTKDGFVIMGSEVGLIDIPEENVLKKGRLQPGKIYLVDFNKKELIRDEEVKGKYITAHPYGDWIKKNTVYLNDIPTIPYDNKIENLESYYLKYGYSREFFHVLFNPMITNGIEALGSMGNDQTLACLSHEPKLAYQYFKQLFAQVTNPPIDPIREKVVVSLRCPIGPEQNILEITEDHCKRIVLDHPILDNEQLHNLKNYNGIKIEKILCCFKGEQTMEEAIDEICLKAEKLVRDSGVGYIILSDKVETKEQIPIPSLFITGAVHHHLNSCKLRTKTSIILEAGDARLVNHFCLLLGYGADAINPWLVFNIIEKDYSKHFNEYKGNYIQSVNKGVLKVMSKMGVSCLQSYKGAQIFEAIGIHSSVIDKCFKNTTSRIQGVKFKFFEADARWYHNLSMEYESGSEDKPNLSNFGQFQWRNDGDEHLHNPNTVTLLQHSVRSNSKQTFEEYVKEADKATEKSLLRGFFKLKYTNKPTPLEEVESAANIVKRFATGAMSYGSISLETHETIAQAMNKLNAKSNTGEGGEDPDRSRKISKEGYSSRSAIKQIASGRFGVTIEYLTTADVIQIKLAQGAKPGEGGELPGSKVTENIAKTRHSIPGVGLISPPPHHDIYSIEDLSQLIFDLKNANPKAYISVKLVSEIGVGLVAAGVAKAKADHIVISGHDGGTGAAAWTGIKHTGLPWELGMVEVQDMLLKNDFRDKVRLQCDGGIRTPKDIIVGGLLGSEEFGFGTIPLITLGCVMMRKCHLNTCPVGIATQDPELRKNFAGKPEHLINFFFMLAEEVRKLLSLLGAKKFEDIIGRSDLIEINEELLKTKPKYEGFDLSYFNQKPPTDKVLFQNKHQDHELENVLDQSLIAEILPKLLFGNVEINKKISNSNRSVGAMLSHQICKIYPRDINPMNDDHITVNFDGHAGQSFAAFLQKGITFNLTGDSNDFVGKGLSGGKVIIKPPKTKGFIPHENVIAGNVCFYGATGGEGYISGKVAERFSIRNSGAVLVVEGIGDHGCEYMTGGRVVNLGNTGKNFAAGMSGGIAYLYNPEKKIDCNLDMVDVEEIVDSKEQSYLHELISNHSKYTNSVLAKEILENWEFELKNFSKIFPHEYRRVLEKKIESEDDFKVKNLSPRTKTIISEKLKKNQVRSYHTNSMLRNKLKGFMTVERTKDSYRNPLERSQDYSEIFVNPPVQQIKDQSSRCMDCGTPFCQSNKGCPISNLIPEWNDLIYKHQWKDALQRLHLTNNFPEFTGKVCPAPCEGACTLGIIGDAVTIKNIENAIIQKGFENGWILPNIPSARSKFKIAIIGSGPAGLTAADQLNKMGHNVTILEREDRIGGLLMYGIPNMKLGKDIVQRRVNILMQEGIEMKTNVEVGVDVSMEELNKEYDAILMAVGSNKPRDLDIKGRDLKGVHFAMEFLTKSTKSFLGSKVEDFINAKDKNVVIIGSGDTSEDCLSTSVRHKASSITVFARSDKLPMTRTDSNPWPEFPKVYKIEYGAQEVLATMGKTPQKYNTIAKEFIGKNGQLTGVKTVQIKSARVDGKIVQREIEGSERIFKADLVLLAMGYIGPEDEIVQKMNVKIKQKGELSTIQEKEYKSTQEKVFVAGDCRRGQSLVVWAIKEGREVSEKIHNFLNNQQRKNKF